MTNFVRVFAVILMFASGAAKASNASAGNVTTVLQTANRFFFYTDGKRTARPVCDCCDRWEIVVDSLAAQAKVSAILTALSANKKVVIYGTGSCVPGEKDTEGVTLFSIDR